MIDVVCHTNLDLHRAERWPTKLAAVPRVGDEITSAYTWPNDFRLSLQVVGVRWTYISHTGMWIPKIELHMTEFQKRIPPKESKTADPGSIVAFYEWYAPLIGSHVSAFI